MSWTRILACFFVGLSLYIVSLAFPVSVRADSLKSESTHSVAAVRYNTCPDGSVSYPVVFQGNTVATVQVWCVVVSEENNPLESEHWYVDESLATYGWVVRQSTTDQTWTTNYYMRIDDETYAPVSDEWDLKDPTTGKIYRATMFVDKTYGTVSISALTCYQNC